MLQPPSQPDLFAYKDYRAFLRDWYTWAKSAKRGFSFRAFSRKAHLASPNFLKLVMDGERNLSEDGAAKFALGLDLNKQETECFKHLVAFTQTKNFDEKLQHEKKMMTSRKLATLKPIESDQYRLFAAWYHPVILELIGSREFDGTPEWLSRKLLPSVPTQETRKSLELLERLGFLQKTGYNTWKSSAPVVSTGPEANALILLDFHRGLLELAKERLIRTKPEERDMSSLCIGIRRGREEILKKRIQEFRQEIIREFSAEGAPEDVVLLNVQMFPVTTRRVREKDREDDYD